MTVTLPLTLIVPGGAGPGANGSRSDVPDVPDGPDGPPVRYKNGHGRPRRGHASGSHEFRIVDTVELPGEAFRNDLVLQNQYPMGCSLVRLVEETSLPLNLNLTSSPSPSPSHHPRHPQSDPLPFTLISDP